jgi:predicted metal-binding membrane protein
VPPASHTLAGPRTIGPLVLVGLVACAWLALLLWGASPYAQYLGHNARPGGGPAVAVGGVALFLVGWVLMIVAMMLPTATKLLSDFGRVTQARPERARLQTFLVAGFVAVWVAVGSAFQVGDNAVHAAVRAIGFLDAHDQLVAAAVLVGAGIYQFTPLKHRCLTACRAPRGFIFRHWRGGRPEADALRIGMAYGVSCVGCCWSLMLVLFALGMANLAGMLGVGAVMAAEKGAAHGPRLAAPLGAALIAAGGAIAVLG